MPIPTKQEDALEALRGYLEYADLRATNIGLRNLLIAYVHDSDGLDNWFVDFLEEVILMFQFLDKLQFIYPGNENMNTMDRQIKS